MQCIQQSARLTDMNGRQGIELLKACEYAARNCYASQDKITEDSCFRFVRNLISRGHEAPLEFGKLTFDLTTSRAVLAEITRHRLASFCVESQRYIQEAGSGHISFITPEWFDSEAPEDSLYGKMSETWKATMKTAEDAYCKLILLGAKPEEAREVLPNSTACRIIMCANLREWRTIFRLRCSKAAYPQMRSLALQMLRLANEAVPVVFEDLMQEFCGEETADTNRPI